jgi:hypothetical protein
MTLIRVNPESVRRYGAEAQSIFDTMHASLVSLVNEVAGVRYFGPNAVTFKTESGRLAADFANRLHLDMAAMADAVRTSTTNIASSLGGAPIAIRLDPRPIVPPTPQAVDYVDVDTGALESLLPVVTGRFDALRGGLTSHLARLQATDWQGNAKLAAIDSVSGFTASARQKCEAAEHTIVRYVRSQLQSVVAADR